MKYIIIIPDGCADEAQESLGGKTPLQAANVPFMDAIAKAGVVGQSDNVPPQYTPGSDVANLSLFGYDPDVNFTGRAPLEAAAQGIEMGPADWAIRCNLVTIQEQIMQDFTADHISSEEGQQLLLAAQEALDVTLLKYFPGVSYRNLLIYRGENNPAPFSRDTRSTPPHDLTDKTVLDDYPRGPGSDLLNQIMSETVELFANHPVNQARIKAGKLPATNVWLWGIGQQPSLKPFAELHHNVRGAMITAVDLLRGLAALVGWRRIEVPGATGYTDTDYAAKGKYALEALADDQTDLICVHVEATDEASHEGDIDGKIKALQEIDTHIVKPLWEAAQNLDEYRILVSPDHPTFIRTKTHSHGFVPFTIAGSNITADHAQTYDEVSASQTDLAFKQGFQLMDYFIGK